MKAEISALMDDALERHEAARALEALHDVGEAIEAWRTYHLIGDVMGDTRLLSAGFAARVAECLRTEPTVLAPARAAAPARRLRWAALSAAASVAAVALVAWMAFSPQGPYAPQQAAVQGPVPTPLAQAEAARVPPPDTAADYLLAHQGYSPLNSLQGAAPYVRSVSSEVQARQQ